jgi:PAS domain S-box-containing protein
MDGQLIYANPAFQQMSGFGDGALGRMLADFYTPENFARLSNEVIPPLLQEGAWRGVLQIRRPDGSEWMGQTSAFVLTGPTGEPTGMAAIFRDITEQLQAEQERITHIRMIEEQQVALRELGTPLIPIADGVIAMPLIGAIDASRAQQILEALLQDLSARHAAVAILDITGLKVVDNHVATVLVRTAQAAKLLGAEVVLTGIRPWVAQSLVEMGAELHGIVTCGTFQNGIAYALNHSNQRSGAGRGRRV